MNEEGAQTSTESLEILSTEEFSNNWLVETAWEVCNQVGGIYTVIQSKAPSTVAKWGDNYFLLGPYIPSQAAATFESIKDYNDPIGQVVRQMNEEGFDVYYGRWLIAGRPKVVLFNPDSVMHKLGVYKYLIWEHHNIDLPDHDGLVNQVVSFGMQATVFLTIFSRSNHKKENIVAHFHEWMAGIPIPEIRRENLPIKTVFTTHATMLGRYLAMNDSEFYNHLPFYDWEKEATHFNILEKVKIERAASHGSHVFSTVSEITGKECEYLLGRVPDVILPNGLSIARFEAMHEFQNMHKEYKEKINSFVMGHFFQSYSFDLDKTLYFFTSGRFEYFNKGYDVTLEALARLNWKMKEQNLDYTVVMFFITKNPVHSINSNVLESRAQLEEIQRNCEDLQANLGRQLFYNVVSKKDSSGLPNLNEMLDEHLSLKLRKTVRTWSRNNMPPIITHDLVDEEKDPIMNFLKTSRLLNFREDKVKVVYHPDFIASTNPLFRMEYYDFIRGCHMGIFPSYYEPWGYTPLECSASGIPSITSNLSGFGSYVEENITDYENKGIYVINRKDRSMYDAAEDLANQLLRFIKQNRRERIMQRNRTEASSVMFGWRNLGKYYDNAYKRALNID